MSLNLNQSYYDSFSQDFCLCAYSLDFLFLDSNPLHGYGQSLGGACLYLWKSKI